MNEISEVRYYYRIIILLIMIIFNISCSDNIIDDQNKDVLIPLKIGNFWKYKKIELNSDSTIKSTRYFYLKVISDTIIDSKKYYKVISYFTDSKVENTWAFLRNNQEGLYLLRYSDTVKIKSLYKYPSNTGESYKTGFNDEEIIEVKSTDYKFTTQTQEFKCYYYHNYGIPSVGMFSDASSLICPNIGLISQRSESSKYYPLSDWNKTELIEYHLN